MDSQASYTKGANKWSSWQNIERAKIEQRGYFGIYRIRMVDEAGNCLPIKRLACVDKEGIIYIGKAAPRDTLAKRISDFERTSKMGKANHSGGDTYVLMCLDLKCLGHTYKNHRLQYSVMHVFADATKPERRRQEKWKHKIEGKEASLLADYFYKYCELPPCNSSFPEKFSRFTDRLQKLWGHKQTTITLVNSPK